MLSRLFRLFIFVSLCVVVVTPVLAAAPNNTALNVVPVLADPESNCPPLSLDKNNDCAVDADQLDHLLPQSEQSVPVAPSSLSWSTPITISAGASCFSDTVVPEVNGVVSGCLVGGAILFRQVGGVLTTTTLTPPGTEAGEAAWDPIHKLLAIGTTLGTYPDFVSLMVYHLDDPSTLSFTLIYTDVTSAHSSGTRIWRDWIVTMNHRSGLLAYQIMPDGTITKPITNGSASYTNLLANISLEDLDGDGLPEALISDGNTGVKSCDRLRSYTATGWVDVSYDPNHCAVSFPRPVALADFTGDSTPDVLIAASVYTGTAGVANFDWGTWGSTGVTGATVFAYDINYDSVPEAVYTGSGGTTIVDYYNNSAVLTNIGDFSYAAVLLNMVGGPCPDLFQTSGTRNGHLLYEATSCYLLPMPTVWISLSRDYALTGEVVTATVNITDGANVGYYDVTLPMESQVLIPQDASIGNYLLEPTAAFTRVLTESVRLMANSYVLTQGVSGNGTLGMITFTAGLTGQIFLTPVVTLGTPQASPLSVTVNSISFRCIACDADFNGDGVVDEGDLALFYAQLVSGQYDARFDLYRDGHLDGTDVQLVLLNADTYCGTRAPLQVFGTLVIQRIGNIYQLNPQIATAAFQGLRVWTNGDVTSDDYSFGDTMPGGKGFFLPLSQVASNSLVATNTVTQATIVVAGKVYLLKIQELPSLSHQLFLPVITR